MSQTWGQKRVCCDDKSIHNLTTRRLFFTDVPCRKLSPISDARDSTACIIRWYFRPRHRHLINVHTFPNIESMSLPPIAPVWERYRRGPGKTVVVNRTASKQGRQHGTAAVLETEHWRVINDRMMSVLLLFTRALSRQYTAAHPSLSFIARTPAHRLWMLKQMARNVVICQKVWIIMPFPLPCGTD